MRSPTSYVSSCSDGVHRCGIFCAISIIIETLKTEQVVDVFQVVKALRLQNPDFVTGLVSPVFCPRSRFDNDCVTVFVSDGIQILLQHGIGASGVFY